MKPWDARAHARGSQRVSESKNQSTFVEIITNVISSIFEYKSLGNKFLPAHCINLYDVTITSVARPKMWGVKCLILGE